MINRSIFITILQTLLKGSTSNKCFVCCIPIFDELIYSTCPSSKNELLFRTSYSAVTDYQDLRRRLGATRLLAARAYDLDIAGPDRHVLVIQVQYSTDQ